MGNPINVMLPPLPTNKRKRKYTHGTDAQAIDDTGSDHGHEESNDDEVPAKA